MTRYGVLATLALDGASGTRGLVVVSGNSGEVDYQGLHWLRNFIFLVRAFVLGRERQGQHRTVARACFLPKCLRSLGLGWQFHDHRTIRIAEARYHGMARSRALESLVECLTSISSERLLDWRRGMMTQNKRDLDSQRLPLEGVSKMQCTVSPRAQNQTVPTKFDLTYLKTPSLPPSPSPYPLPSLGLPNTT